ncbi:hypothetical protein ABIC83_002913 [Roseateles asaccharophilus]|uniref:hypothetical protein n=1 Tax=Roseateles asaccharophilus TaxID=582607 RepID=UPI003832A95C
MTDKKYPPLDRWVSPGTRYCDSAIYDEATDEVVHGFQVYVQKSADGTPTGRRSFVNNQGVLCGITMAEQERAAAMQAAAPQVVNAAVSILRGYGVKFEDAAVRQMLSDAVAVATGVRL